MHKESLATPKTLLILLFTLAVSAIAFAQGEPAIEPGCSPEAVSLQRVARFLELEPPQVAVFQTLLSERQQAATPVKQTLSELEAQLQSSLSNGAPPEQIGLLVLHIHQARQSLATIQQTFMTHLDNLLFDEQRQRFELVRRAAQIREILPAFHELGLLH